MSISRLLGPGVERREGSDDPRLALGDDQFGSGNDEHGRGDHRQPQPVEEGGMGHGAGA